MLSRAYNKFINKFSNNLKAKCLINVCCHGNLKFPVTRNYTCAVTEISWRLVGDVPEDSDNATDLKLHKTADR